MSRAGDPRSADGRARRATRSGRGAGHGAPGGGTSGEGPRPTRFVAGPEPVVTSPLVRLRLHPADRPLVASGDPVVSGQPVVEQYRETFLVEVPARGPLATLGPGDDVDPDWLPGGTPLGRAQTRQGDRARLLFTGADGIAHIALGRTPQPLASPVDGRVTELEGGHLGIRAVGVGLTGRVGWGQPVHGRLMLGVSEPDMELRASAIDIAAAGSILVAGARLDIEALTRARAIGVAGIICGGLVGRELRQLDESDQRQRAALHASTPFAVLALDGFGRRVLPASAWDLLVAAAERPVGLLPDARLAVIGGDPATLAAPVHDRDAVRIAAGEATGRLARLVGLAGPTRRPGGAYLAGGFIEETGADGSPRRRIVPLSDLERLG